MTIPDAAIEAAAEGLWDHRELHMVGKGYECYCGERVSEGYAIAPSKVAHGKHQARAALEAAMPAIREAIAQEIEAEGKEVVKWLADTRSDATDMGRLIGTEDAYKDAIRIVRGGTP